MADGTNLQNKKMSSLEDGPGGYTKVQDCSTVQKVLFVIFVVLFIALCAAGIVYGASLQSEIFSQNDPVDGRTDLERTAEFEQREVCTSMGCVITAARMALMMDRTADPCHNFDQYACGGFYQDTVTPDDTQYVTSFSIIEDETRHLLLRILGSEVKPEDRGFIKKIKNYYKTCRDVGLCHMSLKFVYNSEPRSWAKQVINSLYPYLMNKHDRGVYLHDTIERLGLTPYTRSKLARQWPTLNPTWDPVSFNLTDSIVEYTRGLTRAIFRFDVNADLKDISKNLLHFGQPTPDIPLEYMLKSTRNQSNLMAYEKYYQDIAIEMGAPEDTARQDAKKIVDFQFALYKIMVTRAESTDMNILYNPSTLQKMNRDYPFVDFHAVIQAAYDPIGRKIPKTLPVNILHLKYFNNLKAVLDVTDKRTIMNSLGFSHFKIKANLLTKKMRALHAEFTKAVFGTKEEDPRWLTCIEDTSSVLGDAVGKAFAEEAFPEASKIYINEMIDNLKESFAGLLKESKWMDPKTAQAALLKLADMRREIGYPDYYSDDSYIEEKYKLHTVHAGEYYKTYIDLAKHGVLDSLRPLGQKMDKDKWLLLPSKMSGYYSPVHNNIAFTAAMFQAPIYSANAPSSVSYGAIGAGIGHEIIHGYDHKGKQFDRKGNFTEWWHLETRQKYRNRTKCLIDQYSNYEVEQINMKVNGMLTIGKTVADLGGLKASFRAYKAYAATRPEELPLPGLGLSPYQQFFLSFGQIWCEKMTDDMLKHLVLTKDRPPGKFRIIGTLQNLEEFSKVFDCHVGSPMNPAKKCEVW